MAIAILVIAIATVTRVAITSTKQSKQLENQIKSNTEYFERVRTTQLEEQKKVLQTETQQQVQERDQKIQQLQDQLKQQSLKKQNSVIAKVAPAAHAAPMPTDVAATFAKIRFCESGGNYANNDTGHNGHYGAYQFDVGTWGGYGGYKYANQAPPAVQDAKAMDTYARRGFQPWYASIHCWNK